MKFKQFLATAGLVGLLNLPTSGFSQGHQKIREIEKYFVTISQSSKEFENKEIDKYFGRLNGIKLGAGREFPKINGELSFSFEKYYKRNQDENSPYGNIIYRVKVLNLDTKYRFSKKLFEGKIGDFEIYGGLGIGYLKAEANAFLNKTKVYDKHGKGLKFSLDFGFSVQPIKKLDWLSLFGEFGWEKVPGGNEKDDTNLGGKELNFGIKIGGRH